MYIFGLFSFLIRKIKHYSFPWNIQLELECHENNNKKYKDDCGLSVPYAVDLMVIIIMGKVDKKYLLKEIL